MAIIYPFIVVNYFHLFPHFKATYTKRLKGKTIRDWSLFIAWGGGGGGKEIWG